MSPYERRVQRTKRASGVARQHRHGTEGADVADATFFKPWRVLFIVLWSMWLISVYEGIARFSAGGRQNIGLLLVVAGDRWVRAGT